MAKNKKSNKKPASKSSVIARSDKGATRQSPSDTAEAQETTSEQVEALRQENDAELQAAAENPVIPTEAGTTDEEFPNNTADAATSNNEAELSSEEESIPLQGETGGITICIPFKASAAKSNELMYALRAWEKFLPNVRIIIIGDFPDWAEQSDSLIHLTHVSESKNPQIDVACKMLLACESDLVPEYFAWSNDDIYPTSPITITDLDIQTAEGKLGKRGSDGSIYQENAARTLKALKKGGINEPFDYATHTPVVFNKEALKKVIEEYKCTKEGHLVSTLYFNTIWQGYLPLKVDNGARPNHEGTRSYVASVFRKVKRAAVEKAFSERKFINNNDAGWSSVEPVLMDKFTEKSSFEK